MKKIKRYLLISSIFLFLSIFIFTAGSPKIIAEVFDDVENEGPAKGKDIELIKTSSFFVGNYPNISRSVLSQSSKNEIISDKVATITVLTSGLGTNASVWCPKNGKLIYGGNSLIERLRSTYGAEKSIVLYAQTGEKE